MNEENKHPDYYRGFLISEFAQLEKAIDYYICKYFLTEEIKVYEMMQVITDRLTFEAKRTALKNLLDKKSLASGFVKTNSKSWPSSSFLEELRLLNLERNIFAHYPTFLTDKNSLICLIEFRDTESILSYDSKKYYSIFERINKAMGMIFRDEMQSN